MVRMNLKNNLITGLRYSSLVAIPRVILALSTAFAGLALWACGSNNFDTSPPAPPERPAKKTDSNLSPNENGKEENQHESEPIDPKRALTLQITGLQPDAWWNNCLKVEMNGKTFDIGCTKDTNVTAKIVRIPIPEGVKCPVLDLKVETFHNTGETCNERAKQGLPCEGPYTTTPNSVRKYSVSAERVHFVLTEGVGRGAGRVVRAFFEDQASENISKVKADPGRAEELGVDFNDAVFELSTLEVPFEISGAPATKCN